MIGFLSAAFVAGLVGSPHCIGMCGGFAVLCGGRARDTLSWHLGRMTAYALLGALAGTFGGLLPGPSWVAAAVSFALMLWFAAGLAGLVPEPRVAIPGLAKLGAAVGHNATPGMRYLFGIVTGFLPCGLVYATLGIAVATGAPATGALAMAVFGLGTAPLLSAVALGLRRMVARDLRVRRLLAAAVLAASLWSLAMRQGILGSGPMRHSGTHGTMTMPDTAAAHQGH
jgi:sulfite exporter TauE/SafE